MIQFSRIVFLILCFDACIFNLHAQKKIFKDDTTYLSTYQGINLNYKNYMVVPAVDFRDNLSDGCWSIYSISKKDSVCKNSSNYIIANGCFKGGLRHGKFDYYSLNYIKGKKTKYLSLSYSYLNGLLNGYYYSFLGNGSKREEGYYKNGKKNGVFIEYYLNGFIKKFEYYKNDSLQSWTEYYNNGIVYIKGFGENENLDGDYISYDIFVNIHFLATFNKGILLCYKEYYSDGTLLKIATGVFNSCSKREIPFINENMGLINGEIKYYNQNTTFKKKELVKNSKIVE